jgi:hypothetical protein
MRTIPKSCKHYLQTNSKRYLHQSKTLPGRRHPNKHTKLCGAESRVVKFTSLASPSWSRTGVFALRTVGMWRFPRRRACGALLARYDRRGGKRWCGRIW